jgi:hypothetical protein
MTINWSFQNLIFILHRSKLEIDYNDIIKSDNLEKQLADIQISINELEAWHTRTSNSQWNIWLENQVFIF